MVLLNLFAGQLWRYKHREQTYGTGGWGGEEESGINGENGNPLQYSFLENSMDRGVWWGIVHGVAKSWR